MLVQDIRRAPVVVEVRAHRIHFPPLPGLGERLLVAALGQVPSSGWSRPRLSQRFYVVPPEDGYQEFDFYADPPHGPALPVHLPVAAMAEIACPDWLRGVRVFGSNGAKEVEVGDLEAAVEMAPLEPLGSVKHDNVIVKQMLAVYDDSFQPIGMCGGFHIKMKKLRHELELTVTGPDEARIRHCIDQAVAAGLIAAIVAAFGSGGLALPAAVGAFIASLEGCLGNSFQVRIDNNSHWIEWCT